MRAQVFTAWLLQALRWRDAAKTFPVLKGDEVNNLNEITRYEDPVDQWAAEREFELRDKRYDFYRQGGLVGMMERCVESFKGFERAMIGVNADA